jgi:hypothetical protein
LMKICLSPSARVRFASATTVSTEKRVASGMRHLQHFGENKAAFGEHLAALMEHLTTF